MATAVEIHVLHTDLTSGEWCQFCQHHDAVRVPFIGADPATLAVLVTGATLACQGCGADWTEDAGDPRP